MYDFLAAYLTENIGSVIFFIILLCALFGALLFGQQQMDGER